MRSLLHPFIDACRKARILLTNSPNKATKDDVFNKIKFTQAINITVSADITLRLLIGDTTWYRVYDADIEDEWRDLICWMKKEQKERLPASSHRKAKKTRRLPPT